MNEPLQTMEEQLVLDADHVVLEGLVTEVSRRIDHGREESATDLFVSDGILDLGQTQLKG
jgi:hypothetical protein